jgi:hypothetical protein
MSTARACVTGAGRVAGLSGQVSTGDRFALGAVGNVYRCTMLKALDSRLS